MSTVEFGLPLFPEQWVTAKAATGLGLGAGEGVWPAVGDGVGASDSMADGVGLGGAVGVALATALGAAGTEGTTVELPHAATTRVNAMATPAASCPGPNRCIPRVTVAPPLFVLMGIN